MRKDWPGEVPTKHVFGNFKPDRTSRYWPSKASRAAAKRAARQGNSEAHLAMIRVLPCTVCHRTTGIQAHHLRCAGAARERGIGRKASDLWAVSLCVFHHAEVHQYGSRMEEAWFEEEGGINVVNLVMAYQRNIADFDKCNRVLLAHKLAASRILVGRKA